MSRWTMGVLVVVTAGVAGTSLWARQQNEPGLPTIARMFILNRSADEAVPVVLHAGADVQPVEVAGTATVQLAPGADVPARQVRQAWEYQQLALDDAEAFSDALEAAGRAGWDAVGTATLRGGGSVLILKRPLP